MKFTLPVDIFQYALKAVRDLAPSGASADNFGVRMEAKENSIIFSTQNQDLMVRLVIAGDVKERGVCTAPVLSLYSAIASFRPLQDGVGTDVISISASEESHKLSLSTKTHYSSGVKIPHKKVFALLPELFVKNVTGEKTVLCEALSASMLSRALANVSYASSSDKNLQLFSGVFFEIQGEELCVATTDGACIAENVFNVVNPRHNFKAVLTADLAGKLMKSFSDSDFVKISVEKDCFLYVENEFLTVGGCLITEPFPTYRDFFPSGALKISVDKQLLLDNLTNLSYESTKVDDGRVSFSGKNNVLTLTCGYSQNSDIPYEGVSEFLFDVSFKDCVQSIKNIVSRDLIITKDEGDNSLIKFSSDQTLLEDHQLTTAIVPLLVL